MREYYSEKAPKETDLAFAVASVLLNVLILLILIAGIWMFYSLVAGQPDLGSAFLRDFKLYR